MDFFSGAKSFFCFSAAVVAAAIAFVVVAAAVAFVLRMMNSIMLPMEVEKLDQLGPIL